VLGRRTGVVFNDHLKGFWWEARKKRSVLQNHPNEIMPGKRPLSSSSPFIIVNRNNSVSMVAGAAGGLLIMSAVTNVSR